MNDLELYLKPGVYTDSDHPDVISYTQKIVAGITDKKAQVVALYYAVRDDFRYYPYHLILKSYALKASYLLTKDCGYCVEKSNLFAACVRSLGIPARLGYSNVRNHLGTGAVEEQLKTDLLVFHGYAEIFLDEKWIKATPVFDAILCDMYEVEPLDFDGEHDAVFQESDKAGNPFMEYVTEHGTFADVPKERFEAEMRSHYPHLFYSQINNSKFIFEFEEQ